MTFCKGGMDTHLYPVEDTALSSIQGLPLQDIPGDLHSVEICSICYLSGGPCNLQPGSYGDLRCEHTGNIISKTSLVLILDYWSAS